MDSIKGLSILVWILLSWPVAWAKPIAVYDDDKQRIVLPARAERVVSLAPHLTDCLIAIGAKSKIVAISLSDDPQLPLPRIADHRSIDIEKILPLHPDLIVAWSYGISAANRKRLAAFNIPVFISNPKKLNDIPSTLLRLGVLTGHEQPAQSAAQSFQQAITQIKSQYKPGKMLKSVYFQVWHHPFITISKASAINEAIELCGGTNIFGALPTVAPEVSLEAIIIRKPDIIIDSSNDHHAFDELLVWPQIPAVKHHQLYQIDPNYLTHLSPAIIPGIKQLCVLIAQSHTQ